MSKTSTLILNLKASSFVCCTIAKGANIKTFLLVCLLTNLDHSSWQNVFPNPQSKKKANLPFF